MGGALAIASLYGCGPESSPGKYSYNPYRIVMTPVEDAGIYNFNARLIDGKLFSDEERIQLLNDAINEAKTVCTRVTVTQKLIKDSFNPFPVPFLSDVKKVTTLVGFSGTARCPNGIPPFYQE